MARRKLRLLLGIDFSSESRKALHTARMPPRPFEVSEASPTRILRALMQMHHFLRAQNWYLPTEDPCEETVKGPGGKRSAHEDYRGDGRISG